MGNRVQHSCMAGLQALVLLSGALFGLSGCAGPATDNDRYVDAMLAENLGSLDTLRAPDEQASAGEEAMPPLAEPVPLAPRKPPPPVTIVSAPAAASAKPLAPTLVTVKSAPPRSRTETVLAVEAPRPVKTPAVTPLQDLPDLPAAPWDQRGEKDKRTGATTGGEMTVQPDMVLWVTVEQDSSLNGKYTVNEYSAIDFGYIGLVLLNDLTVEEVEAKLRHELEARYLKKATVIVRVAKASYDLVGVSGGAVTPGRIKIGPGSTISLNDALRRAGGLRLDPASARVKVIRNGLLSALGQLGEGEIYPMVNADGKPTIPEIMLANNDLVYVFSYQQQPAAGNTPVAGTGAKEILVLGEVPHQGPIRFTENEPCSLLYLLFKLGDLSRFAKTDAIRIMRRDKNGRETEIHADAKALLANGNPEDDVMLENGDRVIVPARKINIF